MRRALLAMTGLVAGTTLLVSLKSAPGAGRLPEQVATDREVQRAARAPVTPPAGPAPTKAGAKVGARTVPSKAPPAPGGGDPGPSAILGPSVQTPYGTVRVSIKVAGGRLTDVTAVDLPGGEPRSDRLSGRVGPELRSAALAAQSADVDTVSGATFTSEAYLDSLQAALDQANLG